MPANRAGSANGNWKGGGRILVCQRCDVSFAVEYYRRDTAKFCSLKCAGAVGADKIRGTRTARVTRDCDECGRVYELYRCHLARKRFCSAECHATWRGKRMSDMGNPNWIGGLSREPYPINWAAISRWVLKRDGYKCQSPLCRGVPCRLHTHHIDYDKKNTAWWNLIAVCASCNGRANYDREAWKKMYQTLMRERAA